MLRESILARYPGRTPQEYTTIQYLDQSPIAIQSWVNTLGESSDTTYLGTQETFKLSQDPDDFLVVYGVNHAKTEKCLYANINVYTACALCGVATVFSDDYANTAQDYLTGPQPFDPSYLFAYKVARNCNGDPHCLTVPTSNVCGQGASLNDDLTLGLQGLPRAQDEDGAELHRAPFREGPALHRVPAPGGGPQHEPLRALSRHHPRDPPRHVAEPGSPEMEGGLRVHRQPVLRGPGTQGGAGRRRTGASTSRSRPTGPAGST